MRERPRVQQAAVEEAVAFLKKVPPFQFLEDPPLRELARAIELEYYPTGTVILEQDGPPSEHLLVVKKGGAKVFVRADDEETLVDYRAEGDVIGFLSLYTGDRSRTNVVATSDTICYLIGKAEFRRLLDRIDRLTSAVHLDRESSFRSSPTAGGKPGMIRNACSRQERAWDLAS